MRSTETADSNLLNFEASLAGVNLSDADKQALCELNYSIQTAVIESKNIIGFLRQLSLIDSTFTLQRVKDEFGVVIRYFDALRGKSSVKPSSADTNQKVNHETKAEMTDGDFQRVLAFIRYLASINPTITVQQAKDQYGNDIQTYMKKPSQAVQETRHAVSGCIA